MSLKIYNFSNSLFLISKIIIKKKRNVVSELFKFIVIIVIRYINIQLNIQRLKYANIDSIIKKYYYYSHKI